MTAVTTRHSRAPQPDTQLLRFAMRAGVTVLTGSVLFSVGVAVVLAAGWLPLTAFGVAVTVAFTAVTVGFACLQYLGVRRIPI